MTRRRTCTGSGELPKLGSFTEYSTAARPRWRGICPHCGGEYQITSRGVVRVHREGGW